ncbi:hypothetical protein ACE3MQ_23785 [Paenibacillus lentus]|uniref:hypothetical protein n=1 Tax=Paenibacillus lentus TaxID=1338368 RepID=UPI0036675CA8
MDNYYPGKGLKDSEISKTLGISMRPTGEIAASIKHTWNMPPLILFWDNNHFVVMEKGFVLSLAPGDFFIPKKGRKAFIIIDFLTGERLEWIQVLSFTHPFISLGSSIFHGAILF